MTLQRKMSLAFIPVMVVVAGAVILFALVFTRRILSENAYAQARETAHRNAAEVAIQLQTPMDAARILAQAVSALKTLPATGRRPVVSEMLKKVLEENKDFLAVWAVFEPDALDRLDAKFVDAPGSNEAGRFTPVWSRDKDVPAISNVSEDEAANEDYYQAPRTSKAETILQPYLDSYGDKSTKILITSCIVPLLSADGSFYGVVGIDIDMATVSAMIAAIHPYDTGFAFLVSPTGDIIAHPDASLVTKSYLDTVDATASASVKEKFAQGSEWSGTRTVKGKGSTYTVVAPVQVGQARPPWSLGLSIPLEKVMSGVNSLVLLLDGALVVLLGLTWLAMVVIVRIIIRPLRKAVTVTDRIAEGDLTQTLEAEGRDEIGSLGRAINGMSARLAGMIRRVLDSAGRVAASSTQLSASAQDLAAGSRTQASTLAETAASIEQLSTSVEQVSDRARIQEQAVIRSTEGMQRLQVAMKSVIGKLGDVAAAGAESMDKARVGTDTVTRVVAAIQSIAEGSEKIEGIVNVISDIADQTNLLALNASIEAARAGENGRGFAVVASEVSKLAERSASSAKEIAALISRTAKDVVSGVGIAQESLSAMESIITGSQQTSRMLEELGVEVRQGAEATDRVSSAMGEISRISQGIAMATGEQAASTRTVASAIENVNEITQSASASSQEMSEATLQLSALAGTLQEIMEQFKLTEDAAEAGTVVRAVAVTAPLATSAG
jgi:methyl-accepting chemotaxis protein